MLPASPMERTNTAHTRIKTSVFSEFRGGRRCEFSEEDLPGRE